MTNGLDVNEERFNIIVFFEGYDNQVSLKKALVVTGDAAVAVSPLKTMM